MKKTTGCTMSKQAIIADLDEGLKAEYRALDLCNFLLTTLPDEADKKVIARIAKDEERHIEIAKELKNEIINFYGH